MYYSYIGVAFSVSTGLVVRTHSSLFRNCLTACPYGRQDGGCLRRPGSAYPYFCSGAFVTIYFELLNY